MLRPGWGNIVMKLIPREHRFVDFSIQEETAISLDCKEKKGYPPHKFLKIGPGFVGKVGRFVKRSSTRWLGKEGTAYTWETENDKYTEIPGGLAAALKTVWGEEFYNEIPEAARLQLEENKILVTVDLSTGLTPAGMRSISEEDIKRETDRKAAENLWEAKKQVQRGQLLNYMIWAVAGFGVACALIVVGILKLPTATPTPQQTANILRSIAGLLFG